MARAGRAGGGGVGVERLVGPASPVEHLDRHDGERCFQPLERQERELAVTGAGGRKAMNVSAPIVMIGAVSPIARDMPMITPVRMPGIEYGTMWSRTVCHWSRRARTRPRGSSPGSSGSPRAWRRSRSAGSAAPASGRRQDALARAERVDEQAEREQAVDDRGHAREVGDVDLDDVGDPVLRRVLLEVDARRRPRAAWRPPR